MVISSSGPVSFDTVSNGRRLIDAKGDKIKVANLSKLLVIYCMFCQDSLLSSLVKNFAFFPGPPCRRSWIHRAVGSQGNAYPVELTIYQI
jgi:hypothetical protein